jgi:acyl phosphate:glycerol-3-phosphate acyltransferase
MIVNAFISIIVAIVMGYFIGSIPTAYIVTRLKTGKDIRQLGGGNVGGLNTYKEVGIVPALFVTLIDIGKGAAVAAISHWILHLNEPYTLIAIAAAVVGHSWMVWLKFSGGKGMGVVVGSLLIIMPVYGYELGLIIIIAFVVILFLLTRNVALSLGMGLMALPFLFWLGGTHSGLLVIWYIVIAIIAAAKFTPTALKALSKNKNIKDHIKGH